LYMDGFGRLRKSSVGLGPSPITQVIHNYRTPTASVHTLRKWLRPPALNSILYTSIVVSQLISTHPNVSSQFNPLKP
jgi:hypothetical protein